MISNKNKNIQTQICVCIDDGNFVAEICIYKIKCYCGKCIFIFIKIHRQVLTF